jgi:hypothetical protein
MTTDREQLFEVWAPTGGRWSAWAKPVLFANLPPGESGAAPAVVEAAPADPYAGLRPAGDRTAVVVDLPGADGIACGLSLARRGHRPVPLFNGNVGPSPTVDPAPVQRALIEAASTLAGLDLPPGALPAFLLDARRMTPDHPARPGEFDNRWMVFPQDLPSAGLLAAADVAEVVVAQRGGRLADDLAHVLRRWQEGGLAIRLWDATAPGQAERIEVPAPRRYRSLWYRALALLGLRRSLVGGFGTQVPTASGGFG